MNAPLAQSDSFDILRIIAQDSHGLTATERQEIRNCADELEAAYRAIIIMMATLVEEGQHNTALQEQLTELKKKFVILNAFPGTSLSVTVPFDPYIKK